MAPLRVGYVREHFASPLLQFAEQDQGKTFTLKACPGGTGQLIKALEEDEVDLVIALTDALIAGIVRGSQYKLVGSYVSTPLNWAVVTGKDSIYNSIGDLKGTTFGISRKGSGSELMAKLMALQQEWVVDRTSQVIEELKFQVNNTLEGLKDSVNDGSTSAFLWEWFTTKPSVDKGEVRFIGSVPTPWPSWLIAAHSTPERAPADGVIQFVSTLGQYTKEFDDNKAQDQGNKNVEYIRKEFGYNEEDIRTWMATVGYVEDLTAIDGGMLAKTLDILCQTSVVTRPEGGFNLEGFTNEDVVRLV